MAYYRVSPFFLRLEPTSGGPEARHPLVPPPPQAIDFFLGQYFFSLGQFLTPQNKTMKGRLSSSLTIYFFMGLNKSREASAPRCNKTESGTHTETLTETQRQGKGDN